MTTALRWCLTGSVVGVGMLLCAFFGLVIEPSHAGGVPSLADRVRSGLVWLGLGGMLLVCVSLLAAALAWIWRTPPQRECTPRPGRPPDAPADDAPWSTEWPDSEKEE
jgi:hypothetical protein